MRNIVKPVRLYIYYLEVISLIFINFKIIRDLYDH